MMSGAAISAPLLGTLISGCQESATVSSTHDDLQFFDSEGFSTLQTIIDTILPKTDSPSATEVGVHHTIDTMVGTVYTSEEQEQYKTDLESLLTYLDKSFIDLSKTEKLNKLLSLESQDATVPEAAKNGFKAIKQQTIAYYLSTEEVGTKFLNYLPVPGEYEGCIDLSSVNGKAWAI